MVIKDNLAEMQFPTDLKKDKDYKLTYVGTDTVSYFETSDTGAETLTQATATIRGIGNYKDSTEQGPLMYQYQVAIGEFPVSLKKDRKYPSPYGSFTLDGDGSGTVYSTDTFYVKADGNFQFNKTGA